MCALFFCKRKNRVRTSTMKRINTLVFALFFLVGFLSCKYDSTNNTPPGTVNISLVNVVLDSKPFSYTYSNASVSPQIILTFSEPIDHQSAQSSIVLGGNAGSSVLNFSFSHHDSVVSIVPGAP